MENTIRSLEKDNPHKGKYKTQKASTLLNAREFHKGRKIILSVFENGIFPLPKQYPLGMHGWREDEMNSSEFLPEEDEDKEFYTPKETTSRDEIPDFIINRIFENEEEITPRNTPDLEREKSAEQRRNQERQGLKILTPDQMLSRLPITLAQLKAGNNSEKLRNEIRQLLHLLYRSKKLSKTIYSSLINTI